MTKEDGLVPKLFRGFLTPIDHRCAQGGHAHFWPKKSNDQNKLKTEFLGALLVATSLLHKRISFFLKLDKKWLSYEQYSYAHIWAQAPIKAVFCLKLRQISIFFNETTSIRSVGTKYMF